MNLFCRFDQWFDGLEESRRFVIFMTALLGWLPLMFIPHVVVNLIGLAWMVVVAAFMAHRIQI